jgi:MFS family permease
MGGLVVVTIGSIGCAAAVSLPMLIASRVVQGIGAGCLQPLAASLLFRQFEPLRRLRVTTALSLPISIAPAAGPLVGGIFVQELSWRWVFLLNLPISVGALLVALLLAREAENRAVRPLDARGAVLTVVGFGATVLGLERLVAGNAPVPAIATLAVGIAAMAILIPMERRKGASAFLDVNLLRIRTFAKTTSITAAHSVGFMGFGLAGPLLLQTELGFTSLQAGLFGAAGALGPMLSGRIARPYLMRVGPRVAIASSQLTTLIGLSIVVLGYAAFPHWTIAIGVFLAGGASFMTVVSCQTVGFSAVPQSNLGDATALDGTSRQMGNAIAISGISAALAVALSTHASVVGTVALTLGTLAAFHVLVLGILVGGGKLPMPGARPAAG